MRGSASPRRVALRHLPAPSVAIRRLSCSHAASSRALQRIARPSPAPSPLPRARALPAAPPTPDRALASLISPSAARPCRPSPSLPPHRVRRRVCHPCRAPLPIVVARFTPLPRHPSPRPPAPPPASPPAVAIVPPECAIARHSCRPPLLSLSTNTPLSISPPISPSSSSSPCALRATERVPCAAALVRRRSRAVRCHCPPPRRRRPRVIAVALVTALLPSPRRCGIEPREGEKKRQQRKKRGEKEKRERKEENRKKKRRK